MMRPMTNLRTLYHPAMYDPAPVPSYWEATAPGDDPAWTPLDGDATPSRADIAVTKEVREAAARLGIALHDHLIACREGPASFKSLGLL